eukprot:TRINITY_DN65577_c0_g1_i1.p1 TRINITY_DN65577_c0_g1~~TRINITY_DN65577_c0_g1_i1.p1  ORF type:complete len:422 (+),score=67.99 TRINITY_DN65577_c0_g1_i1:110-1375(+)
MIAFGDRAALRALLRLCRTADREPAQLVALLGRPPRLYDPDAARVVRAPGSQWPLVDNAISEACGGSTEYAHPGSNAAAAVRRYLRQALLLGTADLAAELRDLGRRIVDARMVAVQLRASPLSAGPLDVKTPVGQEAKRETSVKPLHRGRPQTAPSRTTTMLSLSPISRVPLAAGDFLITHPLAGLFQPLYDKAVILMLHVDPDTDTAQGLLLNKPGEGTLAQLVAEAGAEDKDAGWEQLAQNVPAEFAAQPIHHGGQIVHDSLDESVMWLHTHGEVVADSREVAPDVFLGGSLNTVAALANARQLHGEAAGIRIFRGFSAWSLSQLTIELERGVWARARACCKSAAYELCLGRLSSRAASTEEASDAKWRAALEECGLPALARYPRGPVADRRLLEVLEKHHRMLSAELIEAARVSRSSP